jgi:hypothetical protein
MRWGKALAGAAVLAALATAAVIGQPLTPTTLTGNEAIVAATGGPGGPSTFVTVNQLRNATGYVATATCCATVTIPNTVSRFIITAQPAAGTLSLPASPVFDGSIIEVINGTASAFATNAVTVNPNTGQTLVGGNITITTLGAGASIEVTYSLSNNTWYRVR